MKISHRLWAQSIRKEYCSNTPADRDQLCLRQILDVPVCETLQIPQTVALAQDPEHGHLEQEAGQMRGP